MKKLHLYALINLVDDAEHLFLNDKNPDRAGDILECFRKVKTLLGAERDELKPLAESENKKVRAILKSL